MRNTSLLVLFVIAVVAFASAQNSSIQSGTSDTATPNTSSKLTFDHLANGKPLDRGMHGRPFDRTINPFDKIYVNGPGSDEISGRPSVCGTIVSYNFSQGASPKLENVTTCTPTNTVTVRRVERRPAEQPVLVEVGDSK